MIYFLDASGGIVQCMPESVYQGAAEGNKLFLVSPHAASAEVSAAFRLPDGTVTPRFRLEYAGALNGYSAANGQAVCGWSLALPASVTAQYGTVRVQFFFMAAGQGQEASAAAQFTVERGVPSELPAAPDADAYEDIVSALAALRADLINGYYPARAAVAWNDGHIYGANELVFYPAAGNYGALVRSKIADNAQPPFADGVLNGQYWETVVDFDSIADDYFADIQAERAAAQAAKTAAEAAKSAAETAEGSARASETAAQGYASAASDSAGQAQAAAEQAAGSAAAAGRSAGSAAASEAQAGLSASSAAASALAAQGYMEQAKNYAQREYILCSSFGELPDIGDSAFIYLVPSSSGGTGDDRYSEYLWIAEDGKYEYIGSVNDVDLSGYAQVTGSYPEMTVGNAANAAAAGKAAQDGDGNVISATYAKQNGTYPDMTAGNAGAARSLARTCIALVGNATEKVGWWKIGEVTAEKLVAATGYGGDYSAIVLFNGGAPQGSTVNVAVSGLIELDGRVESGAFISTNNQVKILCGNITEEDVGAVWTEDKLELYCNLRTSYSKQTFTLLSEFCADTMIDQFTFAPTFASAGAPSGLIKAVNVNRAAGAETAKCLESYRFGGISDEFADSYIELCNIPFVASGNASAVFLLNGYRYDELQRTALVEIDVRSSAEAWTYKQVKMLAGNMHYDRLRIYEDEDKTVRVFLHVEKEEFTMTPLSVMRAATVTVNYTRTNAALPSGAATGGNYNFAGYDAEGNEISATYVKKNDLEEGLQRLYPVGSIYFSVTDTNPETLFGFGTWQEWGSGRVPVGVAPQHTEFDTVEKTGGEKTHALSVNEMPPHTHALNYRPAAASSGEQVLLFDEGAVVRKQNALGTAESFSGMTTSYAGLGVVHNILQPYITCYMWKRTA